MQMCATAKVTRGAPSPRRARGKEKSEVPQEVTCLTMPLFDQAYLWPFLPLWINLKVVDLSKNRLTSVWALSLAGCCGWGARVDPCWSQAGAFLAKCIFIWMAICMLWRHKGISKKTHSPFEHNLFEREVSQTKTCGSFYKFFIASYARKI